MTLLQQNYKHTFASARVFVEPDPLDEGKAATPELQPFAADESEIAAEIMAPNFLRSWTSSTFAAGSCAMTNSCTNM
jgi:hypothetical protein